MKMRPRIYYTEEQKALMWDRWQKGESISSIARLFDRYHSSIERIIREHGGIRPPERRRSPRALTLAEREEISRGIATGSSIRSIAASLSRAPSTISREIKRNGGQRSYRANQADQAAWDRAHRPKTCKLAENRALAHCVLHLQMEHSSVQNVDDAGLNNFWIIIFMNHGPSYHRYYSFDIRIFFLMFQLCVISACSTDHVLVDTPNLYMGSRTYPSEGDGGNENTTARLFFLTDRQVESSDNAWNYYGMERSSSLAFGTVNVLFGHDLTWDALVSTSSKQSRDNDIFLNVIGVNEKVRFPETPLPFRVVNGKPVVLPEASENFETATRAMQYHLQERLGISKHKDILLYIHGVDTEFNEAALNLANVWHFTGRHGVPIYYSWPAANEGLFGYFKDRESGDFSVYHVKESIRALASTPGLEKIHIIAHSRGTEIVTTALRELVIEIRAGGKKAIDELKIQNLILAAPDLDFGVVRQRLMAEKFGLAVGQLTVYMNQEDGALGMAQWIMTGLRFGKLSHEDLSDSDKRIFEQVKNVNFVSAEGINSFFGHSYYKNNPAVLSDIAILVRQNLRPGEAGRPLIHQEINFWSLPENYP